LGRGKGKRMSDDKGIRDHLKDLTDRIRETDLLERIKKLERKK
jgi:hypothetical protein